jgi:hypothetical protein
MFLGAIGNLESARHFGARTKYRSLIAVFALKVPRRGDSFADRQVRVNL